MFLEKLFWKEMGNLKDFFFFKNAMVQQICLNAKKNENENTKNTQ